MANEKPHLALLTPRAPAKWKEGWHLALRFEGFLLTKLVSRVLFLLILVVLVGTLGVEAVVECICFSVLCMLVEIEVDCMAMESCIG